MKKNENSQLRSKLGQVRGLGSAKDGVKHWWLQRITAILMIPLSLWFISSILSVFLSPNVLDIARWFASPLNSLLLVLFVGATFYHAKLGLQVVIEDYVTKPCCKYFLLISNVAFCFGGAVLCLMAVLKLHFLNIQ